MEQKESDNPMAEDDAARSTPPSSGRIPLIKIKIPKKADEASSSSAAAGEEVKSHYCKECNKSFNSGKALGGHMSSAHVQANKDYSSKKSSSKRKSPGSSSAADTTCQLCARVFQSEKSLFGHMRCHPEREWRGMEPPPGMRFGSSSSDDDEEEEEEEEEEEDQIDSGLELGFFNLKGWPTSKRGRAPVSSSSSAVRVETKESESFVAGLELIKMLKEDGPKVDLKKPLIIDEERGKNKVAVVQDSGVIDPADELYITAIEVLVSGKRERADNEKKVVMGDWSPEKYKCNVCGRVFPTHQALGGHRSSHNKFKMTIVNTATRDEVFKSKTMKKKKVKEDIVKSNNAHGIGDIGAASTSASASASGGIFAFDLNLEPEEEEEDVVMEGSSNS